MSDRSHVALVVTGLLVHAALVLRVFDAVPDEVRVTAALAALLLVPGVVLLRVTGAPPGGGWLAPAWALGLGIAWNAWLVLLTRALGLPFTGLTVWTLAAHAALAALGMFVRPAAALPGPLRRLPAWSAIAILVAAALAAWHAGTIGPPLTYYSDSPDHIGTIRRMLATGDAFPRDAFFRDAGAAGVDPRKGLWHPQVALIARLAGADPVATWRILAGLLAATFVLAAAALGVMIGGPFAAVVGAWGLLLTYGGSLARAPLREAVFATKLADQLALVAIVAVLVDLAVASRRTRAAAVVLSAGAVMTHLFAALQLAIVLGALGLGLLLRDRRVGHELRRLLATAALLGLVSLPYCAWRVMDAAGPRNLIHTEPQGLLWLWGSQRIVSPGVLWDWMGVLWVLFPLAVPALLRYGRDRTATLLLLTTPLAVAALIFNPFAVGFLEPRLGYLLMRMVWLLPLAGLLAWVVPELFTAVRRRSGWARVRAGLGLAGVALLMVPAVTDGAWALRHPDRIVAEDRARSPLRWMDGLEWMERHLPPGQVVLADPATSYSVPMFTRHYVVTLVDQHSSPNDTLALTRILDARDALDPHATWARTRAIVRRHGVDVVVLNDRFTEIPRLDYWAPQPAWFRAARARLDAAPAAFERIFDRNGFVVYRVHPGALDTLSTPADPRPFVAPFVPGGSPIARRLGDGLPALVSFVLDTRQVMPGDTLRGLATWRVLAPLAAGAYQVIVRFDRPLPGALEPPRWLGKPVRKVVERLRGERYRFRLDHLPAAGAYGVDEWRPDEMVRDSFGLVIPGDVADGLYTVRVKMIRQPHFPNYRLSDYFEDDDYYTGLVAGRLIVGSGPPGPGPARGSGGH